MIDVKERFAQQLSAARQGLVKAAGEECCSEESAKDPSQLIGDAADVQVEDNLPPGVEVPGSEGLTASGDVAEDRGTDVGHVETNGTDVPENAEVSDIIESATEQVTKTANALCAMAQQILRLPDSAFSGFPKQASAEVTEADVENFIVKRASAGDPVAQGIINYCTMVQKMASDEVAPEEVAEGANIEADIAAIQENVADSIMEARPDIDPEQAEAIATQATVQAVQMAVEDPDAVAEIGSQITGEAAEELPEEAVAAEDAGASDEGAIAEELVEATADELKEAIPGISDEEAEVLAVQSVADAFEKEASGEDLEEELPVDDAVAEEPEAAEEAVTDIDEAEVSEQVGQLVVALAEDIKEQDPSISEEEAIDAAAEAVADAADTASTQQALGAVDEAGEPIVDDEQAAEAIDELGKTASANPLRGQLTPAINQLLGFSTEGFEKRLNLN